ncbi:hypothetical protein BJ970_002720 [Saccharopolyspora phatthalungensis]|uniref:Uncharacterized protein n=1 Tax=Saccharopolyspora phatthalungensis TaxID=664693 RepID=A0A840Q3X4_9PSEU|nr:hypothetical protein [Saccharopolyspora phatthalungensis]
MLLVVRAWGDRKVPMLASVLGWVGNTLPLGEAVASR